MKLNIYMTHNLHDNVLPSSPWNSIENFLYQSDELRCLVACIAYNRYVINIISITTIERINTMYAVYIMIITVYIYNDHYSICSIYRNIRFILILG